MKINKIDVVIVVAMILISTVFFYKAGYISPFSPNENKEELPQKNITEKPIVPSPPPSLILPSRKTITSEDEGCHYKSVLIGREWWYFTAIFDSPDSELKNWAVAISFNHMVYGDIFGKLKPDVLLATLYDNSGNTYGGIVNKKRGTLDATTPGLDLKFEKSWAQGEYPKWHVHIENNEIDKNHRIVMDLDYFAHSLPVWTYDNRLLNSSKGTIANYIFMGCTVTGTVELDGKIYRINGTGDQEHAWTPFYIRKVFIDGWDWFHIKMDNGWEIYISKFYPSPQSITSKLHRIIPFGTIMLTPDGESITEFSCFDLNPKQKEKVFLFTKFPTRYSLYAKKTHNIMLQRIDLKLNLGISTYNTYQQIWKFPSYLGIKVGMCNVSGTISWTDGEKNYNINLSGQGIGWTTRALP